MHSVCLQHPNSEEPLFLQLFEKDSGIPDLRKSSDEDGVFPRIADEVVVKKRISGEESVKCGDAEKMVHHQLF